MKTYKGWWYAGVKQENFDVPYWIELTFSQVSEIFWSMVFFFNLVKKFSGQCGGMLLTSPPSLPAVSFTLECRSSLEPLHCLTVLQCIISKLDFFCFVFLFPDLKENKIFFFFTKYFTYLNKLSTCVIMLYQQ